MSWDPSNLALWLEYHQDRRPRARLDDPLSHEPRLLVGSPSAHFVRRGIDDNERGALGSEPRGEQPQMRRAMPAADHFRLADKGIDRTRAWRQAGEMGLRPAINGIVLSIGRKVLRCAKRCA